MNANVAMYLLDVSTIAPTLAKKSVISGLKDKYGMDAPVLLKSLKSGSYSVCVTYFTIISNLSILLTLLIKPKMSGFTMCSIWHLLTWDLPGVVCIESAEIQMVKFHYEETWQN